MLSMPPAITTSASPQRIVWIARCTALSPEPQSLFRVSAGTSYGRPAATAAWRAGFCPAPAVRIWPRITSSTLLAAMPVFASKLRIRTALRSVAASVDRAPWKLPMAVRVAATITTSVM